MPTLYIIGNGFDIGHNLKTNYWHFRTYLEKYNDAFLGELEKMYGIAPLDDLDWRIEHQYKQIKARRDAKINSMLWQNFEVGLALADEDEIMNLSSSVVESMHLESGLVGIEDTLDEYWEEIYRFIVKLQEYVFKWVRQVRLSNARQQKNAFVDNCHDFFLTFNYTNTLEYLYDISPNQILHIHGGLPPFCMVKPKLGHGAKEKIQDYRHKAETSEYEELTSIYNAIANYYERTLKDTSNCILRNRSFFAQLNSIDSVEVIGHSLGHVDFPYFELIKHLAHQNTPWTIFYHSEQDRETLTESMKALGVANTNFTLKPTATFWD